jgi:hypothetical protein
MSRRFGMWLNLETLLYKKNHYEIKVHLALNEP